MNVAVKRKSWATVKINEEFIDITACAGYRACYLDPEAWSVQLAPDEDDNKLGKTVVEALNASRFLEPREAFTMQAASPQQYELWVNGLVERFGYRSRRSMFKRMKSCSVTRSDGVILFKPLRHHKLESWSGDGIPEENHVEIPADLSPTEIGAALRIALGLCTE